MPDQQEDKNGTGMDASDTIGSTRRRFLGGLAASGVALTGSTGIIGNASAETDEPIEDLIEQMSLAEKTLRTYGSGDPPEGDWSIAGSVAGIDSLGIPPLHMADGPTGAAVGQPTVDFPHPIAAASTFDPSLMAEQGAAMARELKAAEVTVLLGPSMDLFRLPFHSRSAETYGEDPLLAGEMAKSYVSAVQNEGIVATAKHFTAYNQTRTTGDVPDSFSISEHNVVVDERSLRELYLPAFKAAIQEGGAGAVMPAYNRINGTYSSENPKLLQEILKGEWNFDGFVVSDWGGTHSTEASANGLDIEMPSGNYFGDALQEAVENNEVDESVVNEMVHRQLTSMDEVGALSGDRQGVGDTSVIGADEHISTARTIAENASVLLKNEGVLPLADNIDSLAIVGPDPGQYKQSGGGSEDVESTGDVTPAEGIEAATDESVTVNTTATDNLELVPADAGFDYEYYDNENLDGTPIETGTVSTIDVSGFPDDAAGFVWKGTITPAETGTYGLELTSYGQGHVYIDDEPVGYNEEFTIPFSPPTPERSSVDLEADTTYDVRVEIRGGSRARLRWNPPSSLDAAVAAAENNDAVVFLAQTYTNYGDDRYRFGLPGDQESAIRAVANANADTTLLLNTESPVAMPWITEVPAIMQIWYPGQEGGRAIGDLLFGNVNPSGKTPVTFAENYEHYLPGEISTLPDDGQAYPGVDGTVHYDEGVFVGYRHFDEANIEPLFEFGHGLSYTDFEYGDVSVEPTDSTLAEGMTVSVDVSNVGDRDGAEIVQVYVRDVDPAVERPPKELKGFAKLELAAGETGVAEIDLNADAFQYWDPEMEAWTTSGGEFDIIVGASSQDIHDTQTVTIDPRQHDVNGDGEVTVTDVHALLNERNSDRVQNNPDQFDFNDDGTVNIIDVNRLFQDI